MEEPGGRGPGGGDLLGDNRFDRDAELAYPGDDDVRHASPPGLGVLDPLLLLGLGDLVVDHRDGREPVVEPDGQLVDLAGCPAEPFSEEEVRRGFLDETIFEGDDRAYAVQPRELGFQSLAG